MRGPKDKDNKSCTRVIGLSHHVTTHDLIKKVSEARSAL